MQWREKNNRWIKKKPRKTEQSAISSKLKTEVRAAAKTDATEIPKATELKQDATKKEEPKKLRPTIDKSQSGFSLNDLIKKKQQNLKEKKTGPIETAKPTKPTKKTSFAEHAGKKPPAYSRKSSILSSPEITIHKKGSEHKYIEDNEKGLEVAFLKTLKETAQQSTDGQVDVKNTKVESEDLLSKLNKNTKFIYNRDGATTELKVSDETSKGKKDRAFVEEMVKKQIKQFKKDHNPYRSKVLSRTAESGYFSNPSENSPENTSLTVEEITQKIDNIQATQIASSKSSQGRY